MQPIAGAAVHQAMILTRHRPPALPSCSRQGHGHQPWKSHPRLHVPRQQLDCGPSLGQPAAVAGGANCPLKERGGAQLFQPWFLVAFGAQDFMVFPHLCYADASTDVVLHPGTVQVVIEAGANGGVQGGAISVSNSTNGQGTQCASGINVQPGNGAASQSAVVACTAWGRYLTITASAKMNLCR